MRFDNDFREHFAALVTADRIVGAFWFVLALAALLFWVPNDIDTGLFETVRRGTRIGDSLAPVVALTIILAGGLWLVLTARNKAAASRDAGAGAISSVEAESGAKTGNRATADTKSSSFSNSQTSSLGPAYSIMFCLLAIALCLVIMRWLGPMLVSVAVGVGLLDTQANYRALRDTLPWKLVGFVAGGGLLVTLLCWFAERHWSWRRLGIGLLIALGIALVFDLPFEDLLLPPNGDV